MALALTCFGGLLCFGFAGRLPFWGLCGYGAHLKWTSCIPLTLHHSTRPFTPGAFRLVGRGSLIIALRPCGNYSAGGLPNLKMELTYACVNVGWCALLLLLLWSFSLRLSRDRGCRHSRVGSCLASQRVSGSHGISATV